MKNAKRRLIFIEMTTEGVPYEKVKKMYDNIVLSVPFRKESLSNAREVLESIIRLYKGRIGDTKDTSVKSKILKGLKNVEDINMDFLYSNPRFEEIAKKAIADKNNTKIKNYKITQNDINVLLDELPDYVWVKGGDNYIEGESQIDSKWLEDNLDSDVFKELQINNTNDDDKIVMTLRANSRNPPTVKGTPNIDFDGMIKELSRNPDFMNKTHEEMLEILTNKGIGQDHANALIDRMENEYNKRLSKGELLRSELKENDIERLQAQTQRDFDEKLRNQNLRYILPAMIERREKVIAYRLNPELLKGAFAI